MADNRENPRRPEGSEWVLRDRPGSCEVVRGPVVTCEVVQRAPESSGVARPDCVGGGSIEGSQS